MPAYTYLILGGGMTADAATAGIREVDPTGTIGLVGEDPDAPYSRPPLSKALWKGDPLDSVWRKTADRGAELHLGRRVVTLDTETKRATDDRGTTYRYEKLLLATGGTGRRLPFGGDEVIYFRTLADYRKLRAAADAGAVVRRERRQGKGNVVRRMFADIEADVYVLVDGDDTYDAKAAPALVERLLSDGLDIVSRRRVATGEATAPWHSLTQINARSGPLCRNGRGRSNR